MQFQLSRLGSSAGSHSLLAVCFLKHIIVAWDKRTYEGWSLCGCS